MTSEKSRFRSGSRGQYQPVIIFLMLLAIVFAFFYFPSRVKEEWGAEERNYRSFYTSRVFFTTMRKKVEYQGENHTLLQLTSEYLCPKENCDGVSREILINELNSTLKNNIKEEYNYALTGETTGSCDVNITVPQGVSEVHRERASVLQFTGLGFDKHCINNEFRLTFGIWEE